jgi:hypothetical protein
MTRIDLTRLPQVRALLVARGPQLAVQLAALAGLILVIIAGLAGTAAGSRNLATVGVWIAWWAALMLFAVPLFGRLWCSVCPLPLPGEWLQRGSLLKPRSGGFGLGLRWPRRLRGMWLQNAAFVAVALFSLPVLTSPSLTAILLVGLILLAVVVSLVFERRAFCRYVCPIGGFVGLYSQAAPVEVRVRDPLVCAGHTTKTCYTGSERGYGCPWLVFPGSLSTNLSCGVCLECLRTCPLDNIAVNLRPPGADLLWPAAPRADELFKSLLLLGSALIYSLVLLGPWTALRRAALDIGAPAWFGYAAGFLLVAAVVIPGLFLLATVPGRAAGRRWPDLSLARSFSPTLVPLGIAAWAAFSLAFVLANVSYLLPVLSDPLSLGWNLLGTNAAGWTPIALGAWPLVVILAVGLGWTMYQAALVARRHAGGLRLAAPVGAFCLAIVSGMVWVFAG